MNAVTLIAYIIAIAIPAFTVYLFIALDVFGTGKLSTILLCLAWGAIGAFFLAWGINNAILERGLGYDTLARFVAPIIEEMLKAFVLIYLIQHPRFRYIVDGAVYGIAVGIGFAASENIFIYIPGAGSAALGTAITRTLSTAMMHATASGLVGLSLGRLRRSTGTNKNVWPVIGILLAISLHVFYNNIVGQLGGMMVLLVAVGIGIGGGVFIGWQISDGLADEKKRFAETLGMNVGVSTGERKAVQNLGGMSIEKVFGELHQFFGDENVSKVRRLLVLQANVGILQNNLTSSPASDRLKEAWEEEIQELRGEIEKLRKELGSTVNLFLQSVFPSSDDAMQQAFNEEIAKYDPTLVHTFDMFMRSAELAETFTPEQLAAMAERLHHIEIFKNVSLANLENLSRAIDVMNYTDGNILFNEGDEGDAMYLIEQGNVDIFVEQDGGERKLLRTFSPGDVVGEFSLLDGQPRSASAQSKGVLRALRLQRQVFTMFIGSRPQVVLAMLQYLAEKVRYTTLSVETSVNWMTKIAQGTYQTESPVPAVIKPTPAVPAIPEAVELEPAAISEETLSRVEQVFVQAAASLQQREQLIRKQAQS